MSARGSGAVVRRDRADPAPREPVDLRLAVAATAAWAATMASLQLGAVRTLVAGLGAGLLAVVLLARCRRWRPAAGLALVLFAVALVLLPLAARLRHAEVGPLADAARAGSTVQLEVTITADPRPLAAGGVAGRARVAVEASVERLSVRGGVLDAGGAVLLFADAEGWHDVLPGQRAVVDGVLHPGPDGGALSVTLAERGPPRLVDAAPWWQRAAGVVRADLRGAAAGLPELERGLLPGLVDGDTADLDPVLAEHFRRAGLTHLVAVSGTNLSILLGAVLLVARRTGARRWVQALLGGAVLVAFVVVARPSPSVLRAAVMALIALAALTGGRPRAAVPMLAAGVLALLVWDPTLAVSASFTMSVLATGALLVLAPGWARRLRSVGVPVGVAESVAVAAAAHLVTAPVVAAISGQVSVVAVFANVLAEPVVGAVTVLGFAAAMIAPLWLAGGSALAWCAGWPCRWLVAVAEFFGGLDGAVLSWPGGVIGGLLLVALLLGLGAAAVRVGLRRMLAAAVVTALVMLLPVRTASTHWPPPGWLFVACDVGQGDALLLPAGPGAAIEVDAGPDPVPVDRCLREFGIDRIRYLILSHDHVDHVGGLPGVVRGRRVDSVLTGPLAAPAGGSRMVQLAAARERLPVLTPPAGTRLTAGGTTVEVLGPVEALHGTRSDPNNSSLVLRATVAGVRILLPGDAELEEQRQFLDAHTDLRADILKVPHHGSAYSVPEFLADVHARAAVVSVGAHNDYGHPSPLLLAVMGRLGVPLFRTDRDGDVAFVGGPGDLRAVVRNSAGTTAASYGAVDVGAGVRPADVVGAQVGGAAAGSSSARGARMEPCRPAPSTSRTSRTPCRRCSSWWATRSCSWTAPRARSPPLPVGPTRRSWRPSCPGTNSPAPS